jgi:ankyrin repeat protein
MTKKLFSSILISVIGALTLACGAVSIQAQPGYYPPFVKAAQEGNITEAEKLLKTGELVNQTTIGNQTPLHLAAAEGQDDMVKWLLVHEANPIAQDQNGKTPAEFAKSQGHDQTAQLILDYVELFKNEDKAIKAGDTETLRKLLSQDGREYTILHVAAQTGSSQLIAIEIKSGEDVNAQTVNGITPLHKAAVSGKLEIAQMLIRGGANVNISDIYNNTPLYYAISYENMELIKLFLDAGADPNIHSVWGNETALDFAKRRGNAEVIALLEKK